MPFRVFFVLAALDAILGVGVWIPVLMAWAPGMIGGEAVAIWHGRALLLGTVPVMIAGFLRTALPRWTGEPVRWQPAWGALVPLWLAGRAASLWWPPAASAIAAAFLVILAGLTTRHLSASPEWRNRRVAALIITLALAAAAASRNGGDNLQDDAAGRAVLASILGFVMILGGRIAPALTAWHLGLPERGSLHAGRPALEFAAALAAGGALAGWVVAPASPATGAACTLAALAQALRLLQWRGWRAVRMPSVIVIHAAYAGVPLGFALLAMHILSPNGGPSRSAAVHAWAVGAIGVMALAIMSSMVRKHTGRAFSSSTPMTVGYGLGVAACVLRLGAEVADAARAPLLLGASAAWIGAFGLFLIAFAPTLSGGAWARRCRDGHED